MQKNIIIPALVVFMVVGIIGYRHWQVRRQAGSEDSLVLYGNVDIRRVDLGFRVSGRLEELFFEEGDKVRRGDRVAVLDRAPYEQEVALARGQRDRAAAELARLTNGVRPQEIAQTRARVAEHEASLRAYQEEYRRRKDLVARNAVSRQSLDDIRARRDEARARLTSAREALALAEEGFRQEDIAAGRARLIEAEAQLAQALIRLADTEIIAPHDGVLLTRVAESGAIVAAGQTVTTLSLNTPVWVRAYVPEPDLGKIWPGMAAEILTDSRPDRPYRGQVGFIFPEAEFTPKNVETPRLRTDLVFRLRIIAANPDEGLRQGMPVTVVLDATNPPPARGQGA
ncbi:MAG: secretion protein HlyD [Desulfobacterales bacterium]|jgi:HlyD family secretion protein